MCVCVCVCVHACAPWGPMCQVAVAEGPIPPTTSCSLEARSAGLAPPHQSTVPPLVLEDAPGRMTLLENVRG